MSERSLTVSVRLWRGACFGVLCFMACGTTAQPGVRVGADAIILETDHRVCTIGTDGLNRAFVDRRTGRQPLNLDEPRPFMAIEKDGQTIGAASVIRKGDNTVTFVGNQDKGFGAANVTLITHGRTLK